MIRAIVTVGSLLLAGCTTAAVDASCSAFRPITFSASQDSPETIRQVREFNAAWDAICGR